jgi:hypothetical protein
MDQISFSEAEFQHKKRKTRREKFLERMDALIPWSKLENCGQLLLTTTDISLKRGIS